MLADLEFAFWLLLFDGHKKILPPGFSLDCLFHAGLSNLKPGRQGRASYSTIGSMAGFNSMSGNPLIRT